MAANDRSASCKQAGLRLAIWAIGMLGMVPVVRADPVTYRCSSLDHSHSSFIYLQIDEKLKSVLMGRDQKDLDVKERAFFSGRAVTWTHLVGKANWSYTLEASTGVLTWGPADPLLQKKDACQKVA